MKDEQKKALRQQYEQRKPDMGIVCWKYEDQMWIAISKDAAADYNSISFQLDLGSWPNRELQNAYKKAPEKFEWCLLKKLDYKERDEDHSEDLELLFELCMEEFPHPKKMRPGKR